ncbi:sugar nucleotide-binding protein [Candidatus Microgenomates bacterium]|nr:sugar nucleotide-binding protein [Candidatus Microgenomates bacterium]
MKKIAITGPSGLVGSRIIELLSSDFAFIPLPQEELDITDAEQVNQKFKTLDADLLLHLAAYTNVDGAETNKEMARSINVEGTRNLFTAATKKTMQFVYISTDFVFDGDHPPYDESSVPNPIGYYGQTKYEGEQVVKDAAMVVRITYPYRKSYEARPDFMRSIKRLLSEGKTIGGITDSTFTPTFIDDIAYGLKHLMNHYSPEIYHLVGSASMSPYEAFVAIAQTFGLDESLIVKTTYDEYFKGKAKRPRNGQTISTKNTFQKMRDFTQGLSDISSSA